MNAIAQARSTTASGPKLDNRRVLAGIIDVLIVGVGAAVVLAAGDSLSGDGSDVRGALSLVILGWALYYYFALESGNGQTVGKRLMKLRVVCADGRPAGMREIAVRTVLRVVDGVGMYIVGLIVMLATGERRQRIGDLAASTMVVDASPSAVAAPQPVAVEPQPEPAEEPAIEDALGATQTITLPSRPTPPPTLADLTEPEPVTEEPVLEAEPVVEEPVVEVEPVIEPEPVVAEEPVAEEPAEEPLPEMTSPTIQGLAQDVAAAREPAVEEPAVEDEPAEDAPAEDDGPVTIRSVETVSAMDLIMGAAEEDASEERSESEHDLPDSA